MPFCLSRWIQLSEDSEVQIGRKTGEGIRTQSTIGLVVSVYFSFLPVFSSLDLKAMHISELWTERR